MPKLHDVCQIISEEILSAVSPFAMDLRQQAFSIAWSAMITTLGACREDAPVIIDHLEPIMVQHLAFSSHTSSLAIPPEYHNITPIPDIFSELYEFSTELVRRLFP